MAYLKHNGTRPTKKTAAAKKRATPDIPLNLAVSGGPRLGPSIQHDINHVGGLIDVRDSLDWIAKGLERITAETGSVSINNGYSPALKLTFAQNDEDDTVTDFVIAVQRIADSIARLAGLSRPRLERWHEQDEYEPLYRSTAADGGAPGPAQPK